jgi:hypothetical protein
MALRDLSVVGSCGRGIRSRWSWVMAISFGFYAAVGCAAAAFGQASYEADPINYSRTPVNDPIAVLARQVEQGAVTLTYDPKFG